MLLPDTADLMILVCPFGYVLHFSLTVKKLVQWGEIHQKVLSHGGDTVTFHYRGLRESPSTWNWFRMATNWFGAYPQNTDVRLNAIWGDY